MKLSWLSFLILAGLLSLSVALDQGIYEFLQINGIKPTSGLSQSLPKLQVGRSVIAFYCNTIHFTMTNGPNGAVTFKPGASTRMACLGANPSEHDFTKAMSAVRSENPSGKNEIQLKDECGNVLIVLRKKGSNPNFISYKDLNQFANRHHKRGSC